MFDENDSGVAQRHVANRPLKVQEVTFDIKPSETFTTDSDDDEGLFNDVGVRDKGFTKRDQRDMQRLGKKQELLRNFRPLSAVSFTVLIQATWEFILMSCSAGLTDGGLAGLFWQYVFTFVGFGFVMMSLAEMASMAPTSGGQYHWVSEFAPPKLQKPLSYVTGWFSTLSWQAGSASGPFLAGTIIQALITMNRPDYSAENWQGTLLVFAMVMINYVANIWGARSLPLLQNLFLVIHVFGFLAVVIVIWVMSPRNEASVVFTQFYNSGGWSNMGLAVMIGQISAIFSLSCSDATAHMAEEIKDAGSNVPSAMFWAYMLNGTIGMVFLITFLFGVTDVDAALNDDTGYPFMWVFRNAVSTGGVNALTTVVLVLATASNIVFNASTSRQTFAFARDKGLPFYNWIGAVHPTYYIPSNAIVVSCGISCALALINIGSYTAFNAIISLQISALMFTYILSISCVLWRRIKRPETLPTARWSLGKYGMAVNTIGICYSLFAFFFSFWPNTTPVDAETFNWASVLFVAVGVLSVVMYYTSGRKHYTGPVVTVEGRRGSYSM